MSIIDEPAIDGEAPRFILLFFLVCVVVSLITYNSALRTFMLQHNLMAVNEELRKANEILKAASVFFAKELDRP